MNPIYLILDGTHCFSTVEETHLVGLGLVNQQSWFLEIVDCVFGKCSFSMHDFKLQVASFC